MLVKVIQHKKFEDEERLLKYSVKCLVVYYQSAVLPISCITNQLYYQLAVLPISCITNQLYYQSAVLPISYISTSGVESFAT